MTSIFAIRAFRLPAILLAFATTAQLCSCDRPAGESGDSETARDAAARRSLVVMASDVFREPLSKAAALYRESSGADVEIVFGKTGEIVRRAAKGERCDLLLAADTGAIDELAAAGAAGATGAVPLVRERIAVVIRRKEGGGKFLEAQNAPEFLKGARSLAVSSPEYAPSGRLSQKAMAHYGLDKALKGRISELPSDETVIALVKNGDADAGLVFSAPALSDDGIAVVDFLPYEATGGAYYHALAIPSDNPDASAFAKFLRSEQSRAYFMLAGFEIPPPAGEKDDKKEKANEGAAESDKGPAESPA